MAYTFISGATGGLGRAFAIACAKKGYSLFIIGRSQGKISALKAEISAISSVEVLSAVCDLTSERSRKKLLAFMEKLSGIEADLKYALNPRVLLEITCLECASLDENGSKKN